MKKAIIIIAVLFRTCTPSFAQTYMGGGLSVGFGQEQFTQQGKQINKTTAQVFAFNMFGGYQTQKNVLFEGSGLYDGSFRGTADIGYSFKLGGRNSFELLAGGSLVTYFGQEPIKLPLHMGTRIVFGHIALSGSYYSDRVFYVGIAVRAFTFE